MIRLMKRLFTLLCTLVLLAAFGYFVVLPRVLPRTYRNHVEACAVQYQLPQSLIYAVIFSESHFEPDAISSAGAVGLMQVTQETGWWAAAQMGMNADDLDLTDPKTNIQLGCWYLGWLDNKFNGVQETMLAGYNAGHGNVMRWLADEEKSRDGLTLDEIPFGETRIYVKKVTLLEKLYRVIYRL